MWKCENVKVVELWNVKAFPLYHHSHTLTLLLIPAPRSGTTFHGVSRRNTAQRSLKISLGYL